MNNCPQFTTVCFGGPLDGLEATEDLGSTSFLHTVLAGGDYCELMPDDCLVSAGSEIKTDHYQLFTFSTAWSTGYVWTYKLWLHESYLPITSAIVRRIMVLVHPSDCWVSRSYAKVHKKKKSPLFRYGHITLSRN